MSGNKWLNIEVAQNTMEVWDPLINFENNVQMKKHAKSMQTEQVTNPCKLNLKMQVSMQKSVQNEQMHAK